MALSYTELKQAVQDYLENTEADFVSQIDRFIRQAEDRINQTVQVYWQRKNKSGTMQAGNKYLSMPSDWISVFEVTGYTAGGDAFNLLPKEVGFMREAFPNATYTAQPRFYGVFDQDNMILAPTPDNSYAVELHYYAKPASIVDSGASWLGDEFESVLLYGVLVEAYTFNKGDADMIKVYNERYQEALSTLKAFAKSRGASDATRHGTPAVLT